jgi:hydrogenase maturation protease
VWIIDAVAGGGPPGTVHRFDAGSQALPASLRKTSTHATSVAESIELARTLGRLPATLVVYGIAGECFRTGERPSIAVRAAAVVVADAVRAEVRAAQPGS